jgi:hypothetical protein
MFIKDKSARWIIYVTVFLSAYLLFLIQPLIAKHFLPILGGSHTLWSMVLFFFMLILVGGYIYASYLIKLPDRIFKTIHTLAVILAILVLFWHIYLSGDPLLIDLHFNFSPPLQVISLLFISALLPALVLSATTIITQRQYNRLSGSPEPYSLYALSNVGSLLALITYPLVLEFFLSISTQAWIWSTIFIVFSITLLLSLFSIHSGEEFVSRQLKNTIKIKNYIIWLILAAVPTFLLTTTTEYISRGISSFPLLWTTPLIVYLISFILGFIPRKMKISKFASLILIFVSILALVFYYLQLLTTSNFTVSLIISLFSFFIVALFCHSLLYDLRPNTEFLGQFYINITIGGALGSGIVALFLPLVMKSTTEVLWMYSLIILVTLYFYRKYLLMIIRGKRGKILFALIGVIVISILSNSFLSNNTIFQSRNFYGNLKVFETETREELHMVRTLSNGTIVHGIQSTNLEKSLLPLSYYTRESGVGLAISEISKLIKPEELEIGVVGLGVGTLNAYCENFDKIRYYEINPDVIEISQKYFSYIDSCKSKTDIVLGDARKKLSEDKQQFDLLIIDAFSDDAIPIHLLTTEAMRGAYLSNLSENGLIAIHVSNRYVDLNAPVTGMLRDNGFDEYIVDIERDDPIVLTYASKWIIGIPSNTANMYPQILKSGVRFDDEYFVWTDGWNNILHTIFKPRYRN